MDNKKQLLINAGLKCFSKNGYDKTSISDIVETANVAKGLLFYHFKSKKQFFLTLIDYCSAILDKIVNNGKITETDFFSRIEQIMQKRIMFMLKIPYAYDFLMKSYFEESEEVKEELTEKLNSLDLSQLNLFTKKADKFKFKDEKDMNACAKMIVWVTDGIFKVTPASKEQLKHKVIELSNYIELLRQKFYKTEYIEE